MTIVLQHEFWGLEVAAGRASAVTLSFGSAPQRLEIPFDAVRVFADPSVEFGLQFTVAGGPGEAARRRRAAARERRPPRASVAELPAAARASRTPPSRRRPAAPRS